ncbi:hypothetical protein Gotur_016008, partial [Gossypium turneri]
IFASGQVPNLVTCLILLDGLFKTGNLKEALKFFQAMQNSGFELDIVPYTILIDGLCKAGHIEVAKELFHQLSDNDEAYRLFACLGAWEIMTVRLIVAVIM